MSAKSGNKYGRKIRRLERCEDFKLFLRLAKEWFPNIAQSDDRHQFFAQIYGFHILCGGRFGGVDKRTLEVFYGQRPFDCVFEIRQTPEKNGKLSPPRRHRRLLLDSGAALRYERTDDGLVLCVLEPSRSEGMQRPEEGIILAVIREPRVLTGRPVLESHWRALISYLECSSIDGSPTITDRLRTWWLLSTRRVLIDGQVKDRRAVRVGGEILKWVLTIGLSGALLEVVRLSSKAWTGG